MAQDGACAMTKTRLRPLLSCAILAVALAPFACGDETVDGAVAPPDVTSPDATTTGPDVQDAGPTLRTVETRQRFGALDPTNTLLDGDFEYSGMDAHQYPWFGLDYSSIVTGARCRHGLRCAEISLGKYVIGAFVWPDAASIDVEYFAKPLGSGDCTQEVRGALIPFATYNGAPQGEMQISADVAAPEADGWCHVVGSFPVPADTGNSFWGLTLAPQQQATGSILVDDASIRIGRGSIKPLALAAPPDLAKLALRVRSDFSKSKPVPPRAAPATVNNRTGRRQR